MKNAARRGWTATATSLAAALTFALIAGLSVANNAAHSSASGSDAQAPEILAAHEAMALTETDARTEAQSDAQSLASPPPWARTPRQSNVEYAAGDSTGAREAGTPQTPAADARVELGATPTEPAGRNQKAPIKGPHADPRVLGPANNPKLRTMNRLLGTAALNRAEIEQHEADLGRRLGGVRIFRRWNDTLITGDELWAHAGGRTLFISVKSKTSAGVTIPYTDVAAAAPGDAVHAEILRHAQEIQAFPGTVYLAYQHEPEAASDAGTGAEFIAAWRNYVSIFRAANVSNVRFVWTLTGYAFTRTDAKAAQNYWPGEEHLDFIGVDTYNFYTCRNAAAKWYDPASRLDPAVAWARTHGDKQIILMEFSTVADPADPQRQARWFEEFGQVMEDSSYERIVAVLQWSGRNNAAVSAQCNFDYMSSAASAAAMKALAGRRDFSATW